MGVLVLVALLVVTSGCRARSRASARAGATRGDGPADPLEAHRRQPGKREEGEESDGLSHRPEGSPAAAGVRCAVRPVL